MKIDSVIVDHEPINSSFLKKCLVSTFPEIAIRGEACNYCDACELIKAINPALVFYDVDISNKRSIPLGLENGRNDYEVIYISDRSEDAISAIREDACGFILKPLNVANIIVSVGSAIRRFSEKTARRTKDSVISLDNGFLPHTKLIGIPTMEGIDFLHAHEIVRCEGLQKSTRIVSTRKSNMISAYNIGEFKKLLEEYGFFACHKSHLINLMHVKKYTREGFVYLSDNTAIPLARRKRLEFLHQLKHL
jgi:two-component system, LytTR family, response regulator